MNIEPEDSCHVEFQNLRLRKTNTRYIVYEIKNQKIVIDKLGDKEADWDQFIHQLPDNEYRFCVFDFSFTNSDNMPISKLIFITWGPDSAPIKNRVLYATTKESFRKYLDLNKKDFTLGSKSDMTEKDMIKQLDK